MRNNLHRFFYSEFWLMCYCNVDIVTEGFPADNQAGSMLAVNIPLLLNGESQSTEKPRYLKTFLSYFQNL